MWNPFRRRTEAQDITQRRRIEAAEVQSVTRDIAIEARMKETASEGKRFAMAYDMEHSYQALQALKALAPILGQAIQMEAREQTAAEAEGARIGGEEAQAAQAAGQERLIDQREILVLQDILRRLVDINDNKGVKTELRGGGTAQVRPEVIADIQRIRQDLSQLVQLQRLEISDEMREEMLKGEKHPDIINLIRSERQSFGLLTQYITTIEQLLNRNGNAMTIHAYIGRAISLIRKIIVIDKAQMSRIR